MKLSFNKKFNLLQSLIIGLAMNAQNENTMQKQNQTTTGEIITKGTSIYTEITIHASAQRVWEVFTDFENYPKWNPFIRSLKGKVMQNETIEVLLHPPGKKEMVFKPRVLQFEKEKEFRWIGKFLIPRLFDGEHVFLIKTNGDGSCTFVQYEKFRGILVPFLKKMLEINTKQGFEKMNQALKERCEISEI